MSYVGTSSTVLYSTLPFNIPVDSSAADSLVSSTNIFSPQPVSQSSLNVAYTFYPPATEFSLVSSEVAITLLSLQEV